jgi:methionyl-tRNA formyltransferase
MITSVILLTSEHFAKQLIVLYKAINPNLSTLTINSTKELYAIPRSVLRHSRLISFLSTVIVPSEILSFIKYGAYNFHPAPPSRPGWGAHNFAIFQKDDYFGTTLHQMIEYVDAGSIVGVDTFLIPKDADVEQLSQLVRESLSRLVNNSGQNLIGQKNPLPIMPFTWGSQKYSKKDFIDLTHFKADITKSELDALVKAFGEKGNVAQLRFVMKDEIYFYEPETNSNPDPKVIELWLHKHRFTQKSPTLTLDM